MTKEKERDAEAAIDAIKKSLQAVREEINLGNRVTAKTDLSILNIEIIQLRVLFRDVNGFEKMTKNLQDEIERLQNQLR